MKKLLCLWLLLLLPVTASALTRVNGKADVGGQSFVSPTLAPYKATRVCPGAQVTLYYTGTTNKPPTFNSNGSTRANPTTADSNGDWFFYVDGGTFDALVEGCGFTRTIPVISGSASAIASVNVLDYGADSTGATDSTSAINSALSVALSSGRPLYFPSGTYSVTSATSPIFLVTKPIRIYGDGKTFSYVKATAGTATNVDIFEYDPDSNAYTDYITIDNLRIGGTTGSARRGIFFDGTGSGEFIRKYLIHRVWIDSLGGDGIYIDATNSGGGLGIFTGIIDDVWIQAYGAGINSCIKGVNLYDSNVVRNSSLTGTGYSVYVDFYSAGGAGMYTFDNNNCTASSGAYFGSGIVKLVVKNNYFEQLAAFTGSDTAMVDIDGAVGFNYVAPSINKNLFVVKTGYVADALRLNRVSEAIVHDNSFTHVSGRSGIVLTSNADRTFITPQNRFTGAGTAITNSSTSMLGGTITLAAPNSTSSAVANTTTPTVFDKTITIPGGLLLPGDWIELSAQGIHSTTGTPTFKIEFMIGGFVFGQNTITTASGASNLIWSGHSKAVVQSIGASGNFRFGGGYFGLSGASSGVLTGQLLTGINTNNPITCQVRITWNAADPANTTVMQSFNAVIHRGGMSP